MDVEHSVEDICIPRDLAEILTHIFGFYISISDQRKYVVPTSHIAIVARERLAELQQLLDGKE